MKGKMIVVAFLLIIIAVFGFAGGEKKCKDSKNCNYLRGKEWCTKKSVIKKCPRKCGSCAQIGLNIPVFTNNGENECKDLRDECSAMKDSCNINEEIKQSCPKTCGLCGGKKKCKDVGTSCNYWREKGWCFMKSVIEKCPRTCGSCGGEKRCKDVGTSCNYWREKGWCFMKLVIEKCPRTCGLCGGENKCKDPASCNYLKGKRWCKMKSVIEKCPGKCGSCAKAADIKWHENKDDANEKKLMPSRMIPRGGYRDIGIFRGKNGRFHQPSRDYRGGYDLGYAHNAHYSK